MKAEAIGIALLIVIPATFSILIFTPAGSILSPPPQTGYIGTSWAQWYANLSSMTKSVDVIAVGQVVGVNRTITGGLPFTDFDVKLLNVIKPVGFQAPFLTVRQTGINQSGKVFQVEDDPLFKINQTYVFFLFHARTSGRVVVPGLYYVAAGPEGRFVVNSKGLVYSLDIVYPSQVTETIPTRVDGQPLTSFVAEIESGLVGS